MPSLSFDALETICQESSQNSSLKGTQLINDAFVVSLVPIESLVDLNVGGASNNFPRSERVIASRHVLPMLFHPLRVENGGEEVVEIVMLGQGLGDEASQPNRGVLRELSLNADSSFRERISSSGQRTNPESLDGNPLRVEFISLNLPTEIADSSFRGDVFLDEGRDWINPVSWTVARQALSRVARVPFDSNNRAVRLWIACDGKDAESRVLASSCKISKFASNFTEISHTILSADKAQGLLTDFLDGHTSHSTSGSSMFPIEVSARYYVRTTTDVDDPPKKKADNNGASVVSEGRQMVIEPSWTWGELRERRLLQAPSPTEKRLECKLRLTIGGSPGEMTVKHDDQQRILARLYDDLIKLESFLKGLTGGDNLVWFPRQSDDIKKQFRDLMEMGFGEVENYAQGESDGIRLDLIAKMWNVLKFCSSSQELQECLDIALTFILKSKSTGLSPRVFSSSASFLARLMTTDLVGHEKNPLLGRNPLLILAELGVDKMRQEYRAFGADLLPQIPLEKLAGFSINKLSKDPYSSEQCLENFTRIITLHYLVDSLTQIKTFFPSANLESSALKSAQELRKSPPTDIGQFKTVTLDLKIGDDVKPEHLQSPTSWMAVAKNHPKTVTLHLSQSKVLPIQKIDVAGQGDFFLTKISSTDHVW